MSAQADGVVGGPLDFAAGEHAIRIAIDQQAEQDFRMVGGAAAACVGAGEWAQVDSLHGFDNEARQMVFGVLVLDRGRQ